MNANLFARLRPALERDRLRPVLFWHGEPVTAGALLDRAARIAGHLRSLGVEAGDRVAVQVEKSPETVALYLGALQAGAI